MVFYGAHDMGPIQQNIQITQIWTCRLCERRGASSILKGVIAASELSIPNLEGKIALITQLAWTIDNWENEFERVGGCYNWPAVWRV